MTRRGWFAALAAWLGVTSAFCLATKPWPKGLGLACFAGLVLGYHATMWWLRWKSGRCGRNSNPRTPNT